VFPTIITSQNTTSTSTTNSTSLGFAIGNSVNLPNYNIPYIGLNIAEILAIVAVILLGLFFSRYISIVRLRSRKGEVQGEFVDPLEERRKAISSILQAASANLERDSTKFREIVLECYRLIVELLQDKSAIDGKNLTAREFKEIVSKALIFDSETLSEATKLFELAKYSQKEITREQALEAAECLKRLSEELLKSPFGNSVQ
jgi:hypothetical protein